MSILFLILLANSEAYEGSELMINGDVKSFFVAGFPDKHLLQPSSNYGQAFVDGRLKLRWQLMNEVYVEAHHAITYGTAPPMTSLEEELLSLGIETDENATVMMTGVGLQAPEVVELSWKGEDGDLFLQGRTDRLFVQASLGSVDIRLGRQPISFGHGLMFNPMDLVQPFSFATIDSEYKPGIDSFRIDGYIGMSSQITGLVAYAGEWDKEGMIAIINGNTTLGWTDVSLFYGLVKGDNVFGTGTASSIGPVGVHADVTVTIPEEEDSFVRAVAGFMWKPLEYSTFNGELYLQTVGAESPEGYVEFVSSDRYSRGELWLMGRYYASFAMSQEVTSLVTGNVGTIVNLVDSSFMITPSIQVSVSDEVQLVCGSYIGAGEEPEDMNLIDILSGDEIELPSEFGITPSSYFLQMKAYF